MITFVKLLNAETGRVERVGNPAEISELLRQPGRIVWLDVQAPTPQDLALLGEEFGFHQLPLEDCLKAHQRPKFERYGEYYFMVFYEVEKDPTVGMRMYEVAMFVGPAYVVTVHHAAVPLIHQVETRWEIQPSAEEGASYLAYLMMDSAVDSYFPMIDHFSDRLEALEEAIFDRFDPKVVARIFELKKQTLMMRRLVSPLRDVFLLLLRRETTTLGQRTYIYYQDVLDHLLRISDAIDTYRDLVTSAVDAYMSQVSNRTNEVMKVLTVFSTVLMTAALVAGIYGMNFKYIPELDWPHGYAYSLALMVGLGLVQIALFKWRRYI
ncbi:MAG TPA: magnesium/cobalt transporter CorA [Oscillatoriaceae cyanobacterium]